MWTSTTGQVPRRVDDPRDGVWVQSSPGEDGSVVLGGHAGNLVSIPEDGLKLNPRVYHATSPEAGSERKVMVGYLPHATRKLSMRDQLGLA